MSSGARNGVLKAMGLGVKQGERQGPAIARCKLCRSDLEFSFGEFGQTIEMCSKRTCPNAVPHHPEADTLEQRNPRHGMGMGKPGVARKRRGPEHATGPQWKGEDT